MAVQGTALAAAWVVWKWPGPALLWLALVYVLATWIVAGGITLWVYVAFSLAPFSDLVVASLQTSASVMWLVPGTLLLASRSQLAMAAGLVAVINSTRLLASSRAPKGAPIEVGRRARRSAPMLFRDRAEQPLFSRGAVPTMLGALALQTGIYAIAGDYPLLTAVSFAAVTAIWTAMAVARGAMAARTGARAQYRAPVILLTLLLTVTLTAVLVRMEIEQEGGAGAVAAETAETPALTRRVLRRLAHVPPEPAVPSKIGAAVSKEVVTRIVGYNGVPGVVLRSPPKPGRRPSLIWAGSQLQLSSDQPLAIPFTGEYHLFPTSSGSLPKGAVSETGTPLENLFGTIGGGTMETVAVQTFDPPIDLTHCRKVLVALTSAETGPALASMQLVAERGVEDAGTELVGNRQAQEETLEFLVPATGKPLRVHAIRILFQRPVDRYKNMRVAVLGFTLVPFGQ